MHLAPIVFKEADALLKVLLAVQAVADELDLLEGDLADDKGVRIAGEAEAQHLTAAAAEVGHLEHAGGCAGGIVDDIEAVAVGDLTHEIHRVSLCGVDGLNAHGLDELASRLVDLGDYNAPCARGLREYRDVQADGSAAGDEYLVALLHLGVDHDMLTDSERLAEDSDLIGDILIERDELVNADLGVLCKAAVDMDAEELQVLADPGQAALAGSALAAGDDRVHQHALAELELAVIALRQGLYGAEDLMAENSRDGGGHVLAAVDGNVGAADACALYLDERFIFAGNRHRDIAQLKIEPIFQYSCFHCMISLPGSDHGCLPM